MSKRKSHGWYCKVCGQYLPNEKFSGKGHAAHICKECMKFPVEKRNEMMTVNKICKLPFRLSRENKNWLERMRQSQSEEIRSAAEWAWGMRFEAAPKEDEQFDLSDKECDLSDDELRELFDGEVSVPEEASFDGEDDFDLPFS